MKQTNRLEEGEEAVLLGVLKEFKATKEANIHLRPFVVIANFSRKFCDLNRAQEEAFEDEQVVAYYKAYHGKFLLFG